MARKGAQDSEVRAQLIDAARELIQEEGIAAVTARRLADRIGLKRQIVHYYFGTLDELFIAVLEEQGDAARQRFRRALQQKTPLRVTWEEAHDASATLFEFIALAMHRESIREVLKRYMDEFREMQANALAAFFTERDIDFPPLVCTLLLASVSQTLALERALGVTLGHADTNRLISSLLDDLEVGKTPSLL
jgi:AcrR family transcriptional regulator